MYLFPSRLAIELYCSKTWQIKKKTEGLYVFSAIFWLCAVGRKSATILILLSRTPKTDIFASLWQNYEAHGTKPKACRTKRERNSPENEMFFSNESCDPSSAACKLPSRTIQPGLWSISAIRKSCFAPVGFIFSSLVANYNLQPRTRPADFFFICGLLYRQSYLLYRFCSTQDFRFFLLRIFWVRITT